nr:hypothetical protein [Tanacetum cinerariifolium]
MRELRENTFSGNKDEDAYEHAKKGLEKKVEQPAQAIHASITNDSKSVNQVKTIATKSSPNTHCSTFLDSNIVLCTSAIPDLIEQENVMKTRKCDEPPKPTPIICTFAEKEKRLRKGLDFSEESIEKSQGEKSTYESGAKFISCFDGFFVEFIQPCFCFPRMVIEKPGVESTIRSATHIGSSSIGLWCISLFEWNSPVLSTNLRFRVRSGSGSCSTSSELEALQG